MIIEPGVYRRFPYRVAEENANEKKKMTREGACLDLRDRDKMRDRDGAK